MWWVSVQGMAEGTIQARLVELVLIFLHFSITLSSHTCVIVIVSSVTLPLVYDVAGIRVVYNNWRMSWGGQGNY